MSRYQITACSFPDEARANAFVIWAKAEGLTSACVVPDKYEKNCWLIRLDPPHLDIYRTPEFHDKEQEWLYRPAFFDTKGRGAKLPFLKRYTSCR